MKQYVVDAFTDRVFSGNPAAVCFPDEWPTSEVMLNIARENRFSETAFVVREGEKYHLRWFTPGSEIDLCGHATLAAAFLQFPNAGRVTIDKSALASVRPLALLRDVTRLELKNLKALDLTPLAGMAKLKTLSLTYCQIDDFTPLAGLAVLTDLECYGAEVKSFAPLAACPNLDRVYFYAAKSTPEGYASLGLLKQVKKFHGGLTKMTSVAWLRQVPQAEEVKIFAEKIDDLSPIGSLPNLTYLRLWDMNGGALSTAVGDLAFLANCKKLEVLELPGSSFTNTDALAGLTALKSVDLSGGRNAQPVSIAFATKLPGLTRLNLSDANVIDGALVASLPQTVRVTTNDKTQGVPKN